MSKSVLATYVWVDVDGSLRSKIKVLKQRIESVKDAPEWNVGATIIDLVVDRSSDILLRPQRLYTDPFRGKPHVLVLCDCWIDQKKTSHFNSRLKLKEIVECTKMNNYKIKVDQQFTIFDRANEKPFGWIGTKDSAFRDNTYYCGTGGHKAFGQRIVEKHAEMCVEAGVGLLAYSAERMPGMWRFELEEMKAMKALDDWAIAKYILCLLTEKYNVYASFDPTPYNAEKVGPHLIIGLSNTIQPKSLASRLGQSVNVQDINDDHVKITIKDGCDVIYSLTATTESLSETTTEDYVEERVCKPESVDEEPVRLAQCAFNINNGVDAHLLMAEIIKINSE